jgi:hypothetical protein
VSGATGEVACAGSGLVGGTRVGGLGGWQLAAGDDEDVDAGGTGLLENPPYDPPAHGDVRPAAVDRADQDLGDLVLLREADDGPEDKSLVRTGNAARVMASLRSLAVSVLRSGGQAGIAAADRRRARDPQRALKLLQTA